MEILMVATYNEDGSVDVMNAAWGTMFERDQVVLNLTDTHKTVKNIKDIDSNIISNSMTYVSQNNFILNDTLKNNIIYGRKVNDEEYGKLR